MEDNIVAEREAVPADAARVAAAPSIEKFGFTGKAGEYFGIWIVNLFLTIVTLGIYSAWAKVRKKRYFYGNTWIAGANFEYHGNPVAILKGRLIAFALFVAYTVGGQFSPRLAAAILLAVLPLMPWLLVRSLAFNAVNSSHRNLRFHFKARWRDALPAMWPFFLLPLPALLLPEMDPKKPDMGQVWILMLPSIAFAALYPLIVGKLRLLAIGNSRYGTAPFACAARIRSFYFIYFLALLLLFVLGALAGLLVTPLMQYWPQLAFAAFPILYVGFGAIVLGYTQSRVGNLVFDSTSLAGRVRFSSTLSARRLARLYVGNAVAIVLTLGLAVPWAAIRTMRYRAECLALECEGGLESFLGETASNVGAAGEEMAEMFDVDLSL